MGSHSDFDHSLESRRRDFLKELGLRAELMADLGMNAEQRGKPLASWTHDGMRCQLLQDDRQGILRISIGGGDDLPVLGDYCNFRGDVGKCIRLLERTIDALRHCPEQA